MITPFERKTDGRGISFRPDELEFHRKWETSGRWFILILMNTPPLVWGQTAEEVSFQLHPMSIRLFRLLRLNYTAWRLKGFVCTRTQFTALRVSLLTPIRSWTYMCSECELNGDFLSEFLCNALLRLFSNSIELYGRWLTFLSYGLRCPYIQ